MSTCNHTSTHAPILLQVPAGTPVHLGRGGCCSGFEPHPEHWQHDQSALPSEPIHRGVPQGGFLTCSIQDTKKELCLHD